MLKGIIHVHSKLSYDGQNTLEEIALFAKKRGYGFVGMTEHSDTFDEEKMSQYVKECRRLSSPELILIPGIEFTCDNKLHLIGLGIGQFTATRDPISVARFIKKQDGLSIVAHPMRYDYKIPEGLEKEIDGIEVWNAGYDGRFVPNDRSITLWRSLRGRNDALLAFGGQDLHELTDHGHVELAVPCDDLKEEVILRALKQGDYIIKNPFFRIRPTVLNGRLNRLSILLARRAYLATKSVLDRLTD